MLKEEVQTILGDLMGMPMAGGERDSVDVPAKRVEECRARIKRCGRLPGTKDTRAATIAVVAVPVLYGTEFAGISQQTAATPQARDLGGRSVEAPDIPSPRRKKSILFTVFAQGHRLDPDQVCIDRLLTGFAKLKCWMGGSRSCSLGGLGGRRPSG